MKASKVSGRGKSAPRVWTVAALAASLLAACTSDGAAGGEAAGAELMATIRVEAGNGRLAGGEEYTIAEWRSGTQSSGSHYADFRGQDGGPTLDLSLSGLRGPGTFSCGEAAAAGLELRVDVNNAYRATADAPCTVEVRRAGNGVIEGRYTATLRHTGNPRDEMTVSGTFRASQAPEIEMAEAPRVGMR